VKELKKGIRVGAQRVELVPRQFEVATELVDENRAWSDVLQRQTKSGGIAARGGAEAF